MIFSNVLNSTKHLFFVAILVFLLPVLAFSQYSRLNIQIEDNLTYSVIPGGNIVVQSSFTGDGYYHGSLTENTYIRLRILATITDSFGETHMSKEFKWFFKSSFGGPFVVDPGGDNEHKLSLEIPCDLLPGNYNLSIEVLDLPNAECDSPNLVCLHLDDELTDCCLIYTGDDPTLIEILISNKNNQTLHEITIENEPNINLPHKQYIGNLEVLQASPEVCDCINDEWLALKALYEHTNISSKNLSGWDDMFANQSSPPTECFLNGLYGVEATLQGTEFRVTSIDLANETISGSIPPEIGSLTYLTRLDLSSNYISGIIPSEIGNLTNLFELNLSNNRLFGSIPSSIGNLTNLNVLDFNDNKLTGSIPLEIGSLLSLSSLNLNSNQLSGGIPIEIGNLTNLQVFNLSNNQLTGSIPSEVSNFLMLPELNLSNNRLSGGIPSTIGSLTNLQVLNLSDNQLSGIIPLEIDRNNLPSLTVLYLSNNQLSGCFHQDLSLFCNDITIDIDTENSFNATWDDFCNSQTGICVDCGNGDLSCVTVALDVKLKLEGESYNLFNRKLLPGMIHGDPDIPPTPAGQPYNTAPWNYAGEEGDDFTNTDYFWFDVDWVLVSLRTGINKEAEIAKVAGILNNDRDEIKFLPGYDRFIVLPSSEYYIVVEHRNHLPVMSPEPIAIINDQLSYNFITQDSYTGNGTGSGQKEISTGVWAAFAGNVSQTETCVGNPQYDINDIVVFDKWLWNENNGSSKTYNPADLNLDGDVDNDDKILWENNFGISSAVPQ